MAMTDDIKTGNQYAIINCRSSRPVALSKKVPSKTSHCLIDGLDFNKAFYGIADNKARYPSI